MRALVPAVLLVLASLLPPRAHAGDDTDDGVPGGQRPEWVLPAVEALGIVAPIVPDAETDERRPVVSLPRLVLHLDRERTLHYVLPQAPEAWITRRLPTGTPEAEARTATHLGALRADVEALPTRRRPGKAGDAVLGVLVHADARLPWNEVLPLLEVLDSPRLPPVVDRAFAVRTEGGSGYGRVPAPRVERFSLRGRSPREFVARERTLLRIVARGVEIEKGVPPSTRWAVGGAEPVALPTGWPSTEDARRLYGGALEKIAITADIWARTHAKRRGAPPRLVLEARGPRACLVRHGDVVRVIRALQAHDRTPALAELDRP